jgi:hypothetical protein
MTDSRGRSACLPYWPACVPYWPLAARPLAAGAHEQDLPLVLLGPPVRAMLFVGYSAR